MIVKHSKHQRGFTLIETMVSVAILLIAVVVPMSLIGNSLNRIYYVRDEITAINLAQEAVEIVRQRRDTNFLQDANWDDGFGVGVCTGGLECVVDAHPAPLIEKCTGGCTTQVYKDSGDGFFHQYASGISSTASKTLFSRVLTTEKINNNEYHIRVVVSWDTGTTPGSVVVSESIFRWAKA